MNDERSEELPEPGPTVIIDQDPDVELSPNQDDVADLDEDA